MGEHWFERQKHSVLLAILLALSYMLLMYGNGIVSLTHPDEVFYIQSAKEMLAHHSWLTPYIFDDVQFEKPFLAYALFALAIKILGLTPFVARFWPSAFGIIGVGVVYWISWTLFKRKRLSFLSGCILASSFIYLALSRAVLTDVIFSVIVTASLGFFCLAYYDRRYRRSGLILWLAVAALAVLTKGLLGLLFPLATVIMFLLYKKDLKFLFCPATAWAALAFLIIAVPWHILMYIRHGDFFITEYFFNVHWRRVLMAEHARLDNWYFYIMLMFVGIMPWFLFWIPTAQTIFIQFKKKLGAREKLFFLLAWIIATYIFVQPAHSKLASYIFPVFPSIAILIAFTINDALEKAANKDDPRTLKFSAYIMSIFLVCVAICGIITAKHYTNIILDMMPVYLAAGAAVTLAVCIFIFNKKKLYLSMVLSHMGVTFTLLAMVFFARPFVEPWVSCKDISEAFKRLDQSDTPVLASKFYVRGIRYYTDRPMAVIDINGKGFWSPHPIPFLNTDAKVIDFLSKRPVTWAIVKEGNVKDIYRILKGLKYKIEEFDGIGGKYILKIEKIS